MDARVLRVDADDEEGQVVGWAADREDGLDAVEELRGDGGRVAGSGCGGLHERDERVVVEVVRWPDIGDAVGVENKGVARR